VIRSSASVIAASVAATWAGLGSICIVSPYGQGGALAAVLVL
jgi:hypothetical protein